MNTNKNINEDIIRHFNLLAQTQNKIDDYDKRVKELKDKLVLLDSEHKKWQEEKTKTLYSLESLLMSINPLPYQGQWDRESKSVFYQPDVKESKNEMMLNNLLTHMFTEQPSSAPSPQISRSVRTENGQHGSTNGPSYARSPTSGLSIRRKN